MLASVQASRGKARVGKELVLDDHRFDLWVRTLTAERRLTRRVAAAGAVSALGVLVSEVGGLGKKRKKKKKKKKPAAKSCPNGCAFNERCVENQCVPGCISNTTPCGVLCCLNGAETCQDGQCVQLCADRRPPCSGLCCDAGTSCVNGSCGVPCPVGRVSCAGQCCDVGDVCDEANHCGPPCSGGECPGYVFTQAWPGTGQADGDFEEPCGIAADAADNLYVLDCGNDRVVKLTNSGSYVTEWSAIGYGIAVDGSTVYVANGSFISLYSTTGTFKQHWTGGGSFSDVAVDLDGNVYALSDGATGSVVIFSSNGTRVGSWSPQPPAAGFSFATGIAVDGVDGHAYVANTFKHLLQKFDLDGTFDREWGGLSACGGSGQPDCSDPNFNRQFRSPAGVAIDEAGDLFVADYGNDRILVFESDSGYITQFGAGELDGPDSLVVDSQGNVFIADSRNNRVVKYAPANPALRSARAGRRRRRRAGRKHRQHR